MSQIVKCPSCGKQYNVKEENLGKGAMCSCGAKFTLGLGPPPPPPARPPAAKRQPGASGAGTGSVMILCPYCDQQNQLSAKRCKHCGEWIDSSPPVSLKAPASVKPEPGAPKDGASAINRPPTALADLSVSRFCPYCDGEIPISVKKCKHCGEWVKPQQPATNQQSSISVVPIQVTTKFCPHCDGEITISAKKCKHCGEWVESQPPTQARPGSLPPARPEPTTRPPARQKSNLLVKVIVGVVGMAVLVCAVIFIYNNIGGGSGNSGLHLSNKSMTFEELKTKLETIKPVVSEYSGKKDSEGVPIQVCKSGGITSDELKDLVGEPDRIQEFDDSRILYFTCSDGEAQIMTWKYDWLLFHRITIKAINRY